jgi:hypothetical protein
VDNEFSKIRTTIEYAMKENPVYWYLLTRKKITLKSGISTLNSGFSFALLTVRTWKVLIETPFPFAFEKQRQWKALMTCIAIGGELRPFFLALISSIFACLLPFGFAFDASRKCIGQGFSWQTIYIHHKEAERLHFGHNFIHLWTILIASQNHPLKGI